MNVTIKLENDLCRRARHRAVDVDLSLSAWIARIVSRELNESALANAPTLLEALGDETLSEGGLELPERGAAPHRLVEFP